jgi:xylulokinase
MAERRCSALVGLDFGQTQIKAVLFNPESARVERQVAKPPPPRTARARLGDRQYTDLADPNRLAAAGIDLVRALLTDWDGPVALAVSSAGPPLVAVDADGDPVWPILGHWLAVREEELQAALPYDADAFYRQAGSPLWYWPPVFSLAWAALRDPNGAARIRHVLSWGGFLAHRLTGVARAEPSTAGACGAFDRERRTWSRAILAAGHLDPAWFPPVVPAGTALGEAFLDGRPVTVTTGGHDYLAAALAAGIVDPHTRLNVVGTWEMAAHFIDIGPSGTWGRADPHPALHDLHVVPGLGTRTLECWSGGQIEWARRLLGWDVNRFFAAAADAGPQAPRGRWYEPFLGWQFFPRQGHGRRAAFCGLGPEVGPGELARMVLEGVAYLGARMFETLQAGGGEVPGRLVMGGGASRSPLMAELKADMLNCPVLVHETADLSAVGAALLAGMGAGVYASAAEAARVLRDRVVEVVPDPGRHAAYRAALDRLDWVEEDGREGQ